MKSIKPVIAPLTTLLLALGLSPALSAQMVISNAELQQLSTQGQQAQQLQVQPRLLLDAHALEHSLVNYPEAQQTWLRQLLIKQIGQFGHPTEAQQQWVNQQRDSDHILYSSLPDSGHPEPVSVVNIPAQARGLVARWQSIELAQKWLDDINHNRFTWPTMLDELAGLSGGAGKAGLAIDYFLPRLSAAQHSLLVHDLLLLKRGLKRGLKNPPSNLLISKLTALSLNEPLNKQETKALYQWLWSQPTDEYSFAALQAMVNNDPNGDFTQANITQLKLATNNHQLASLALNLLAKHYGDEPTVIDYLFDLLDRPNRSSYAAAALAKIDSTAVKKALQHGVYSPDNRRRQASQLALDLILAKQPNRQQQ
ncbi:MAG: hypothetical protein ACI8WB_004292 [Phenylobacterium sp.]|jgi:hypothetical protein